MPELPEAETIVRGLKSTVIGKTITRAEVIRADILREPKRSFTPRLRGRSVADVTRRAKNVILELDDDSVIWVNLGMTGRLLPFPASPRGVGRPTHPAVRFRFADGGVLIFDDVRRFGSVEHLDASARAERSAAMGPEPLSDGWLPEQLVDALGRSRSPARSWLLDQRKIAGVGNIYAAEALFLAGIDPRTPVSSLDEGRGRALHGAIREVLQGAIDAGGTTIRDYRNAEGEMGEYGRKLYVYGRDGAPCHRCDMIIERVVFSNRSAFLCPTCQPRS
ncbi:MAG: bifunctional DNA-formamidopyrimidine glycosylase/DNA-(apurinic or apyrimidinic site) lyase [Longimicrobiales bacterium]